MAEELEKQEYEVLEREECRPWPYFFSPFLWLPASIKSGCGLTAEIQFGHRSGPAAVSSQYIMDLL